MIPLYAALGAADTISKIAGAATSVWKHLSSPESAESNRAETPGRFASLLRANGVDIGEHVHGTSSGQTGAGSSGNGDAHSSHALNRIG